MDDLRDLYQEVILDHGRNPRNFHEIAETDLRAEGNNPLCGDRFTVFVTVNDEGNVDDASFTGAGCAISTASASLMTEMLKGKTQKEVTGLFNHFHDMCTKDDMPAGDELEDDDLERLMVLSGVREYPMRVKCATLAWHTMNAALTGEKTATTE